MCGSVAFTYASRMCKTRDLAFLWDQLSHILGARAGVSGVVDR